MADQQWPTDERFRRIAAKIADAVMRVRRYGVPVSAETWGTYCPLGCVIPDNNRPYSVRVARARLMRKKEAISFIDAFDRGDSAGDPFARLGLAYRKRFP